MMMTENDWRNKIDDYQTSIQAILGFANFYLWDPATRSDRIGVTVFQGRRLRPGKKNHVNDSGEKGAVNDEDPSKPTGTIANSGSVDPTVDNDTGMNDARPEGDCDAAASVASVVTPDLGVVTADGDGVLAEVKISFPKNEDHWFDDFGQLMRYDAELEGWPTQDGTVRRHDVVLITEQGRASRVKKFFEKHLGDEIRFSRPFVIVSCNRSDNRQQYYFFQRIVGKLTASTVDEQLDDGTKVPMKILIAKYSTVKIYDAEPPLPYMIDLIWSHVILDVVRGSAKFPKLRRRQKLPVVLEVDDIIGKLRDEFTFRSLGAHASEGTPAMPQRSWVINAIETLVALREAEWIDATKSSLRVFFQKYDGTLDHFIKGCVLMERDRLVPQETQLPLNFPDGPPTSSTS